MKLSELFEECIRMQYIHIDNSADYALKKDGNTLYIFFESSNGAEDWRNNLDFPAKPYKRMGRTIWFAHRGFLNVWKSIEKYIAKDIADETVQKIVIVGYSHGAAIAVLCHEYVWFHRPDLRGNIEGYGFGCPRVFWGMQTANLRRRWAGFLVIRNRGDIVTHLPPAFLGYSHVGTVLTIGAFGKYTGFRAHYAENILNEIYIYENAVANPKKCFCKMGG